MKFILEGPLKENIHNLVKKVGYYPLPQIEKTDEVSCIRPLDRSGYPRFHIYLKTDGENLIFNLHLDQKRPIYKGAPAHAGEYDSEIVTKEAERIKQIINQ